ncbi:3-hydroxyacyl-CoA dehydrogenase NAD-binding domain-containing protein [Rhizobium grahamii]|uniref:3-hydroxyacyl-CoA dehydrogenase n=1 Tax=Rhizobium grahamii TaxID=1120045 RepID=A0A370KHL1_9HYPH|nr:3-hydroxyacyl-CoA dehydrogenase NAD-binding domain-containing protein [Rhizobium grahamii]RDJ04792.1 3-hydroxyacyl-CoA dehydrogenase [Rhizobium grahamii]
MDDLRFSETVSGKIADGVLVVTIDNPPVNATSLGVRAGLSAALDNAAARDAVRGIVITGAGKVFVGGADIKEFDKHPEAPFLPDVYLRIEQFSKPVVAAVNGAALGGGCELALACHGRVAAPAASFGLPEVKLGMVPGAGGTQRLPRLVGFAAALEMVGTGRAQKASAALSIGLIDLIATADLVAEASALVGAMAGGELRRSGALAAKPVSDADIDAVSAKILAKARGQSAPAEALRLVKAAMTLPFTDGLAEERSTFLRLRGSKEAAALRHVFFAERAARKVEGLEKATPRDTRCVGVVGTGLMGSGIAVSALNAGYQVIGVEQSEEGAAKGYARISGILDKAVQSGRLDPTGRDERLNHLIVASDLSALRDADLVIEAVFDDSDVKTGLFRRLDDVVRADAILATNTSYLDPDAIAAATRHPERVVGLHFFSPANIMRLVEVVNCARTETDVLATALAFAKRLGKLPIVCGVTEGFIGNRVFSAYRREAEFMVEEGALPHEVDQAMEVFGFPMGLFAVCDMAGLEIAWARRKRQASTRDPNARYVEIADRLCEVGRFGQKSGHGWYAYPEGRRTVDPEVTALIVEERARKGIEPRSFTATEIVKRLLKAMADEGDALLSEGVTTRASDIDLVMINGYGFPAHRGGPMFAADRPDTAPG